MSNDIGRKTEKNSSTDRNKSRHRPGYFTQYMRIYRAKQKDKLAALRS